MGMVDVDGMGQSVASVLAGRSVVITVMDGEGVEEAEVDEDEEEEEGEVESSMRLLAEAAAGVEGVVEGVDSSMAVEEVTSTAWSSLE